MRETTRDTSPICLRVSAEDRALLEAAATTTGQTLSAFMRTCGLDIARGMVETTEGAEQVMSKVREQQRRLSESDERKLSTLERSLGLAGKS